MGGLLSVPLMVLPSAGTVCYRALPVMRCTDPISSLRWRPRAAAPQPALRFAVHAESFKTGKWPSGLLWYTLCTDIRQHGDEDRLRLHSPAQLYRLVDNAHAVGTEETPKSNAGLHGNSMRRERMLWLGRRSPHQFWPRPIPSHLCALAPRGQNIEGQPRQLTEWLLGP